MERIINMTSYTELIELASKEELEIQEQLINNKEKLRSAQLSVSEAVFKQGQISREEQQEIQKSIEKRALDLKELEEERTRLETALNEIRQEIADLQAEELAYWREKLQEPANTEPSSEYLPEEESSNSVANNTPADIPSQTVPTETETETEAETEAEKETDTETDNEVPSEDASEVPTDSSPPSPSVNPSIKIEDEEKETELMNTGIVIAIIVCIFLAIGLLIFFIIRKWRARKKADKTKAVPNPAINAPTELSPPSVSTGGTRKDW
jgi:hypothetical protein